MTQGRDSIIQGGHSMTQGTKGMCNIRAFQAIKCESVTYLKTHATHECSDYFCMSTHHVLQYLGMRLTYRNKLHGVDDLLLEGASVCMQHQRHHHDEQDNVGLNVYTKRWAQVDDCHQDQVAQQQTALPPVILVPVCKCLD